MGRSRRAYKFPLTSAFFGLTPQYRLEVWNQIHDLVYHGGGGFIHSEVYNMPIWMRNFHISRISEHIKKQNEEQEKAQGRSNIGDEQAKSEGKSQMGDGQVHRPNIKPSSQYNF